MKTGRDFSFKSYSLHFTLRETITWCVFSTATSIPFKGPKHNCPQRPRGRKAGCPEITEYMMQQNQFCGRGKEKKRKRGWDS